MAVALPLTHAGSRAFAQTPPTSPLPTSGASPTPAAAPTVAPTASPAVTPAVIPTAVPVSSPAPAAPAEANWVQALRPIRLWSGPDEHAIELGTAARWDYFQVVKPQKGPRLSVLVARTQNYAWVDALMVGPSGPPPPGWPPADLPPPPEDVSVGWVATMMDTPLWSDPDKSLLLGLVPPWTALKQLAPQQGPLLHVQDPFSEAESYVEADHVGPIGAPPLLEAPGRWWGIVAVDGANMRPLPTTKLPPMGQVPYGSPVVVSQWVAGEEVIKNNSTWAQLADGVFVYSSVLRPVALPVTPPPPSDAVRLKQSGRWIDLNLTHQVAVAHDGPSVVYVARVSTGAPGWETDPGLFYIQRRVEKETMDSSTLLGRDAERADYRVENVRWTQYFTADGKALHENYWKPRDQFGIPSSHGCVGLVAEDAQFFWDWADLGTPLYAHM